MRTLFNTTQVPDAQLNDEVTTEFGQVYRLIAREANEWLGLFVGMESSLEPKSRIKLRY